MKPNQLFSHRINKSGRILSFENRYINDQNPKAPACIWDKLPEQAAEELRRFVKSSDDSEMSLPVCYISDGSLGYVANILISKVSKDVFTISAYGADEVFSQSAVIDNLSIPVAIIDEQGYLLIYNVLFRKYFGFDGLEIINLKDIIPNVLGGNKRFDFKDMIASETNMVAEVCCIEEGNKIRTFMLKLAELPIEDIGKRLFLTTVTDISAYVEAEETLALSNDKLEIKIRQEIERKQILESKKLRMSRMEVLGEISQGIFHELKQPLANLSLKVDHLLDSIELYQSLDSIVLESGDAIQRQIKRMHNIIDKISHFSRVPDVKLKKINVKKILDLAIDDLSHYAVKGLSISVKVKKELFIYGVEDELEQVFVNLLSNSLDSLAQKGCSFPPFTPKIKVKATVRDSMVQVRIVDNGLGMTDHEKRNALRPFYTTKRDAGGTGLGLFIVSNLIRKLSGTIFIRSVKNKFCCVVLSFPMIVEDQ